MSNAETPTSFQFTEKMRGYVAFDQTDFEGGYEQGKKDDTHLMFQLTIKTEDIDEFVDNPDHEAEATGFVKCDRLGGQRPVEKGVFNLFTPTDDLNTRKMLYRLFFTDGNGQPMTLSGYKHIQNQPGLDSWTDTTTLFVNLYNGHIEADQEASTDIAAAGILKIELMDFLEQLTTFRAYGPSVGNRLASFEKFGKVFMGGLWDVYGWSCMPKIDPFEREIPLYTTEGVTDAEITNHTLHTGDRLTLGMIRFLREPCDDVVMIVHGLTTSSDMFIMPEHYNLAQYLLDNGFTDVWTLDFRMSNHFEYNKHRSRHNMDDIAMYDYPVALAKIREHVGPNKRIHVICHCLGSVSFMMSVFGKAVEGVSSVIANSVALTPRIPWWSRVKLTMGPFFVEYLTSIAYLNPRWRREPGLGLGKILSWFVSLYHRECNVPECHMLSFMWGTGFPALYSHENLLDVTHRRGGDLYGGVHVHYYRHVRKMVGSKNTAVKYNRKSPKYASLPDNYMEGAAEIETPVLLTTGENNKVFRDSNIMCHDRLEKLAPGRHQLHVYPNYGHQDVFMGKDVAKDVFPRMLEFLEEQRR